MGPPEFIGVGAQRSGTTWWFQLLLGHPQIRSPWDGRKELHFFDPFGARPMRDVDVADYHRCFRRRPGQIAGEWTPRYLSDAWTPPLLARAAPGARLLALLRDPLERFRSGVVHRRGFAPDDRVELIASDAIERGRYAAQLGALFAHVPAERVLVLQYERCRLDPVGQFRRTLRFLGVGDHVPAEVDRLRGNSLAAAKEPLRPELVEAIRATLAPDVAELPRLVPDLDLGLWPAFADA